jgi:hypothetical protein
MFYAWGVFPILGKLSIACNILLWSVVSNVDLYIAVGIGLAEKECSVWRGTNL